MPPAAKSGAPSTDSPKKLAEDFKTFQAASHLLPEDAATQWLALVQRFGALGSALYRDPTVAGRLDFRKFATVLPGPASWPVMSSTLAAQDPKDKSEQARKLALQWYAHRLLGDVSALQTDYDSLTKLGDAVGVQASGAYYFRQLQQDLFKLSDNGDAIVRMLEDNLKAAADPSLQSQLSRFTGDRPSFEVPDLVSLVGPEKAAVFLKQVLEQLSVPLTIREGFETRKLAARLALENIATLKSPQWSLSDSVHGGPLYAAMLAKFGGDVADEDFQTARAYELLRLLLAGKTREAVELSKQMTATRPASLPSQALEEIENAGRTREVGDFLHGVLAQSPELPYWSDYIRVSVRAGQSDQMMKLLGETLARPDLKPATRASLEQKYADALLAVDRVDEGVSELIKAAKLPAKPKEERSAMLHGRVTRYITDSTSGPFEAAVRVARLGQLLQRPEWIDQGVELARASVKANPVDDTAFDAQANSRNLAGLLLDLDRGPEAEAVLTDALIAASAPSPEREYSSSDRAVPFLCGLVGVYSAADRSADVLALLKNAPSWNATDLSQALTRDCYLGHRHTNSLGGCAAKALLLTGQKEKARNILQALLAAEPGNDRTYELLVELDKAAAIPVLDRFYESDPFQERPLIWKAKLLFDAGQLDDAEKVARQAIKVDPSDGEEGPGDRMRVYAILADILEAKGKTDDAKIFRGVVQSIRLSEDADQFYTVGLVSRAVAMYEKSLGYFSDAYCIQSRLALRLSELGDWKGAEEHYRRAYELMPSSFGRVESHCFGCERAFAGERQQTIAERVFTKIAAEQPENPQVHYLLGYLHYAQERFADALPEFQRAVALDPDYLNAWNKISDVGRQMHLPIDLRNSVALNILRLDPRHKHSSPNFDGVTDLAAVWQTIEQQNKRIPAALVDLLPLEGSAAALAALANDSTRSNAYQNWIMMSEYNQPRATRTPAQIFADQSFTNAISGLLQSSSMFGH